MFSSRIWVSAKSIKIREIMSEGVSESLFYMWRTLFALAHADDVVTSEEVRFMAEALEDIDFSQGQRAVLNDDISRAQDIEKMFAKVRELGDQMQFFKLAKVMVWSDGDFGVEEREVMLRLQTIHVKDVNLDDLIGTIELALEEEAPDVNEDEGSKKKKGLLFKLLGQ